MDGAAGEVPRFRLPMLVAGVALVALFFSLHRGTNTLRVTFAPPWDRSEPGELYFWLAASVFLLPGCTLIGAGVSGALAASGTRVLSRLAGAEPGERRALVAVLAVLAFAVARIGNQVFLHGQPFTDDEGAIRFGGQVLSRGALWSPLPPMRYAFPELFLFQRGGAWTSFDFLGGVGAWALAELTRTDTLLFSLMAAIPVPALMVIVARQCGVVRGLGAACLFLCSPMALTLSFTSHAHVVSRGLLALGLALVLFVEHSTLSRACAAGLALGLAWATRPPEVSALLAPLVVCFAIDAWRSADERRRLLGLAIGALPAVLATFAYNFALSGSVGFLRGARNEIAVPYASAMHGAFEFALWPPRFGNNLSYNALTLAIWFLGPLGLWLAYAGARTSRTHRALGLGVLLLLCLCLLHDDRGLHMVGPIHLSEAAVPLCVLAVFGVERLFTALQVLSIPRVVSVGGALGYAALGLTTFTMWHTRALEQQAITTLSLLEKVAQVERLPAVVLAAHFGDLHKDATPYGSTGGFVFEWPRATPDLSEPVLVLHDSQQARAEVEHSFPRRTAYVFDPRRYGVFPVPLAEALSLDAAAAAHAR